MVQEAKQKSAFGCRRYVSRRRGRSITDLAERLNLPIVAGQPNADPGAVTYDGIQAALARKADIVLIDTAGRLHTRYNLMEELKKVYRVAGKALPGAPHAVWLVLDATTGQNALQQARAFKEAVNVNGVILAKLDSSAVEAWHLPSKAS